MKKTLLIFAVLAVVGVVVWHFVRQRRSGSDSTNSGSGNNSGGSGSSAVMDDFPLRFGSRGENVRRLQAFLNRRIENDNRITGPFTTRPLLVLDGIWGPLTDAEVVRVLRVSEVSRQLFTSNNM